MTLVNNRLGGLVLAGIVAAVALGLALGLVPLSFPVMAAVLAVLIGLALVMIRSAIAEVAQPACDADAGLAEAAHVGIPEDDQDVEMEQDAPAVAARLLPVMPPDAGGNATSWAGGVPHLPDGTDWPMIDDAPARFLAQIDCSRLPKALWDGLGPRSGALVFFATAEPLDGAWPVHVQHVDGPLTPSAPASTPAMRPCWPLDLRRADDLAQSMPPTAPDWARLHQVEFDDPAYLPFDWASAELLLNALKPVVRAAAADLPETGRASLVAMAGEMADLVDRAWAHRTETAFAGETCDRLMSGLKALSLPVADGSARPLLDDDTLRQTYFAAFERHCREVYTRSSADLPDAQRALFEPLWCHNAYHEAASMGAADTAADCPEDAVLLLDLPSSELLGLTFGQGRSFRILAPRAALADGDYSHCWGDVAG